MESPARPSASLPIGLAALLVVWVATRPYLGVVHDAQLYAIQAIAWRDPARFAEDLFFAFGSQDRFTIFPALQGPLVAWLGLGPAHAAMLALAHALWLLGAWVLASALLPDRGLRLWALAGLILLPNSFGHLGLLRYGEPFVTARPFVEAATLAALGLWLRGRRVAPALLMFGGALLHPLMALPGIGMLVLLRLMAWPRLLAATLFAAALLACLPAIMPDGLLAPLGVMDPEWLLVVRRTVKLTSLGEWDLWDIAPLGFRLLLAVVLLLCLEGMAWRLVAAALALSLLGFLAGAMAGEVAHLHLVIAGQPWRAIWLLTCLSNLLFVPAVMLRRPAGFLALPMARATLILLSVLMVLTQVMPSLSMTLPLPALLLLWQVLRHRSGASPTRLEAFAWVLLLSLAAGWALAVLAIGVPVHLDQHMAVPWTIPRALLLIAGGLLLLAAATRPGPPRTVGVAARIRAVVLPLLGLATIDQRTAWQRFVETPGPEQATLEAFLPAGSRVAWDGGLDLLWFRLQRPSYFSCMQASGVVFFRGTAITVRDRIPSFAFQRYEAGCGDGVTPAAAPPSRGDIAHACRREARLDHIVVATRIERLEPAASWTVPVARTRPNMLGVPFEAGEVFRYDCAALR